MDRISWKKWWNRRTEIPKWKKKEASILYFADAKCDAFECEHPINYSNPVRVFPWELNKDDLWKDPTEYETVELGCLCKHHVEEEISYVSELLGNRECEIETDWYPNGGLCKEIKYIGGKKNGVEVSWHENGQKAKEITYVEGRMVGKSTSWYPNGIKSQEGNYGEYTLSGCKKWGYDGKWTFWNENGVKQQEKSFKGGKWNGPFKLWNYFSIQTLDAFYFDDDLVGVLHDYYHNGNRCSVRIYNKGQLKNVTQWLLSGQICPETDFKDGNGIWVQHSQELSTFEVTKRKALYRDGEHIETLAT
jgi:antitoxin component YwqK of YwqJK toxin-antitoxin module